jgi:hypothetical protein
VQQSQKCHILSPPDYVAHLVYRSRFVKSSVGIKWKEINFASRFLRLVEHKLLLALNGSCFVDKATLVVFLYRFLCMLLLWNAEFVLLLNWYCYQNMFLMFPCWIDIVCIISRKHKLLYQSLQQKKRYVAIFAAKKLRTNLLQDFGTHDICHSKQDIMYYNFENHIIQNARIMLYQRAWNLGK